ncbi:DNA-3-methyladenine glycosylase 2 family protein [Roseateles microcysteis]|uniref:DNA-3-methyladenine glycosylase 2 family protein n=1 Tax=Roseateles microcysteis TaxID=3119057 RepID=UPI002FE59462
MSTLDALHCYPALLARDARFDGRFFVGVTSTGIYCRPVCRVRTPKAANCRFFASAAQAEAQRFRPCLKCRPELAPGQAWSVMDASSTLARQAAELMDKGEMENVDALAQRLGITDRHLRRIFAAEHGVSPLQYLQTRRLLLAKQLLADSSMPITEVAAASGFGSLRRFNAAFVEHYRMQPSSLRRGLPVSACGEPALRLGYRPPYAVDAILQFIAARALPGIETVDFAERTVSRTLRLRHGGRDLAGRIVVRFDAKQPVVLLSPCSSVWSGVAALIPIVRRWLDLDAEPAAIDEKLGPLSAGAPGLRLPGCTDRFELAVRAVLGQQITVAAARTIGGRFVERFGEPLDEAQAAPGMDRLFPRPERIAQASVESIAELGIIRRRAESLIALGQAWPTLAFAQGEGGVAEALAGLEALPGIGPWTASYMLMRGWSWPDAFPPGDVVLKKMLASKDPLPDTTAWQPYRSYAVLQLWREAASAPK